MKNVSKENEWGQVAGELEAEKIKLQSYDPTLLAMCGNVSGKNVLDYGPGPGILIYTLAKLGAEVKSYDIAEEMQVACAQRIGIENVYSSPGQIPEETFDIVICNLVLCINEEPETRRVLKNIHKSLKATGFALIGFCNPKIFNVPESALDIRFATGNRYEENHVYKKIKKEGFYQILEWHRSIAWYSTVFENCGFVVKETAFTPEYVLNGTKISDFVIFRLEKSGVKA